MCKSKAKDCAEVLKMHFHVIPIGNITGRKKIVVGEVSSCYISSHLFVLICLFVEGVR